MLAWVCGIALVVINIIRIFRVPVTFDEVNYLNTIDGPYRDFIHLKVVTANTHILNSILRKFFIDCFENNQFFLRLDNLLAQILFLFASYFTCKKLFKNDNWVFAAFLCLNLNPFLFDFWGLSRGYGLSIGFMMAAIYFLVSYLQSSKTLHIFLCFLFCIAAVYSNFATLNFTLGIAAIVCLYPVLKRNRKAFINLVATLPLLAAAAYSIYCLIHEPIKKLRDEHQFFHGGEHGLIHDTIGTVVKETLFISATDSSMVHVLSIGIFITIVIAGIYWAISFLKGNWSDEKILGFTLWLLLAIPLAALKVQHKVYGTKYLIDRAALFLAVIYILQFCYWLYYLYINHGKVFVIPFWALTICMTINFIVHLNFNSTWEWEHDKNTLVVLERMKRESAAKPGKIKMIANWLFEPSLNYYISTRYKDNFLITLHLDYPIDTTADYIYLAQSEAGTLPKMYIPDTTFYTKDTMWYEGKFVLMKKR